MDDGTAPATWHRLARRAAGDDPDSGPPRGHHGRPVAPDPPVASEI